MQQALKEKSISPCLVDDYRYLNKGIPNFFDYNIKDKQEAKEEQDEKDKLEAEIEKDKQDSEALSFLGQASRQFISWNKTNQCYTLETTGVESFGSQKVSLRSNIVEGKQIVFDTNNPTQTTFKDCYVIKVRL